MRSNDPHSGVTTAIRVPLDIAKYDKMVELVEQMIELNKKLDTVKSGHAKTTLERQIQSTDNQIDQLVYDLYGLTDEEIQIVEQATQ